MPAKKKRPIAPEDNYIFRNVFDPQISPDGRRVAYCVRTNDRESDQRQNAIWIAPVDGSAPARAFATGKKDHSPRWSPDGRSLAFISDRGEKGQIYVAPMDGGDPRKLTSEKHGVNELAWSPDGTRIAYVARIGEYKDAKDRKGAEKSAPRVIRNLRYRLDGIGYFDNRRTHIFVIGIDGGEAKQVTDGDWYDQQPSWSPDGKSIAFSSDRERRRHDRQFRADVWVVAAAGGKARKLTRSRGAANNPSFSPDGRLVAFIGHEHGTKSMAKNTHVMVVPARGGGVPRSISAAIDRSIGARPPGPMYRWLPDGKGIVFLAQDGGTCALYRAGIANGGVSKVIGGERQIGGFTLSGDGNSIAFVASFTTTPPEVYTTRLGGGARERNVSRANDAFVAETDPGAGKRMAYRAADGLEIEAFLLYPPGYKTGRPYPLVLDIHGGPHGAHPQFGFNMRASTLAGAGYVVLMPNPRGSGGYGEAFTEMCVRDWGGADFEDLMTGVDVLVRKGVADPARLYVMGYSYGGFMTTWTVGHTDRFKAAIIGAPVSDHVSMRGTTEIPEFSDFEVVSPFDDIAAAWEASPLAHLPKCTTPVLIEHHEGDLRCPIGQAEEIFQTLKMLGKEVEFLRYPGGFHTLEFHTPGQDVDYQQRAIAWFDSHGGPPRTAAPAKKRRGVKAKVAVRAGANGHRPRSRASRNGAGRRGAPVPAARA